MVKEEKTDNSVPDKLLKGYVDTVFNIWRMGKDAKFNYENNKNKLLLISEILNDHIDLLNQVDKKFDEVNEVYGIGLKFVDSFNLEEYIEYIKSCQKTLEKTITPLKNLSKKYDRTLKILKKNGFQIVEFEGKKFNEGMSIRVLGYDSRSDVEEDIIIETVKPSIFFNDKEYLKGEVIISKKSDSD